MSWRRLTLDDFRTCLSEDEIEKLNTLSLDSGKVDVVLQETLDNAADAFRAAWNAKGYEVDPRDHYICSGYVEWILAFARFSAWTRFPMADNYALSEPRKMQYEKALELLKDPYLATDKVDWTSPDLEPYIDEKDQTGSSIAVPWQATPYDLHWITNL